MENKTIYSFLYFGYEKTVIDSQVITPMKLIEKKGILVKFVFMEGFLKWCSYWLGGDIRKRYSPISDQSKSILPRIPRNMLYINSLIMFLYFLIQPGNRPLIVHARGLQGAHTILKLKKFFKNIKLICDVRSIESSEYEYIKTNNYRRRLNFIQRNWFKVLKEREKEIIRYSDKKFFVSNSLIDYYTNRFKIEWDNISYIPCCVDMERFEITRKFRDDLREKWGLREKTVFIYSGALSHWQIPNYVVKVFKACLKVDPQSYFLGITPQVSNLRGIMNEFSVPDTNFNIRSVPFKDMGSFLVSADIGILLRKENPVNQYACPTKFAEYLAAGLHVLTTSAVNDIEKIVEEENVGTIINNLDNDSHTSDMARIAIESSKKENRISHSADIADKYFNWTKYTPKMNKAYFDE